MLELPDGRLMRRHRNGWVEMVTRVEHSPNVSDLERGMLRGEQVFRRASCEAEVRVVGPDSGA